MYQGLEQEALETWKTGLSIVGFAGPTLYAYRGECQARLGNIAAARQDLMHALSQKPTRIGARIVLHLMESKARPEIGVQYVQFLQTHFPVMMLDIMGTEKPAPAEILQKILHAMRGNRSSTMVMYAVDQKLRFLPLQQIENSLKASSSST